MDRHQKLEKIFNELKAATVDAAACVQNDAPTIVLLRQLEESQRVVANAFNSAWHSLVSLESDK